MKPVGYMLWTYRTVLKQTAGGGGTLIGTISSTEKFFVLYSATGPDDYAAGRNLDVIITDEDDVPIAYPQFATGVDNVLLNQPMSDHSVTTTLDFPEVNKAFWVGKGQSLVFQGSSAHADNEEMTITIVALIKTTIPTIVATSSGTITETEVYSKVI